MAGVHKSAVAAVLLVCQQLLTFGTVSEALERKYYVQAEEIDWDYGPTGWDLIHCSPFDLEQKASVYTHSGSGYIGKVYRKAVFREYTDDTFLSQVVRDESLGILGPPLRAEINDTFTIVFKNAASMPYSMHPHGVLYDLTNEGASYSGLNGAGSPIAPGDMFTYTWGVPDRAGPSVADPNCIVWGYHSHVMPEMDIYAGLVGPLVVCRPGVLSDNNIPNDVSREIFSYYNVDDENNSPYLQQNLAAYAQRRLHGQQLLDIIKDNDFAETNLMHNMNGYIYGNNLNIVCKSERVRWYLLAFGTEVDLHTAHWHGMTVLYDQHRVDVIELLPATFRTVDMIPDNVGQWVQHCHVSDHNVAGMSNYFAVLNSDDPRCKSTPFNDVHGLNTARQALIDTNLARCKPTNSDYTLTIPALALPLGNLAPETYMQADYDDWMGDMQPVLRNLPLYGKYLRCPEPDVCIPLHYHTHNSDIGLLYSFASAVCTLIGACFVFLPFVTPESTTVLCAFMGLAGGLMTWAAVGEIYAEAEVYTCCITSSYRIVTLSLFFLGVMGTILLDIFVHWIKNGCQIGGRDITNYWRKPREKEKIEQSGPETADVVAVVRRSETASVSGMMRRSNSNANLGVESASEVEKSGKDDGFLIGSISHAEGIVINMDKNGQEEEGDDDDLLHPAVNGASTDDKAMSSAEKERLLRMGVLTGLAIAIHNFPEGVATYVSASASTSLGISMALANGLPNIPEGFLVAMPLYYGTGSKWKAMSWSSLAGLCEFFGAFMTWAVMRDHLSPAFFGIVFSWIAGMVVYLLLMHILPVGYAYDPYGGKLVGFFALVGILIIGAAVAISGGA